MRTQQLTSEGVENIVNAAVRYLCLLCGALIKNRKELRVVMAGNA
jgi:hypothetical protein